MKAVLTKNVQSLGRRGDVVTVRRGYMMNYLMPMGLAEPGTESMVKVAMDRKDRMAKKMEDLVKDVKGLMSKLEGLVLKTSAKANKKGILYAAVTEEDVVTLLKTQAKVDIFADRVEMPGHIKSAGEYKVVLNFGQDLKVTVGLLVEKI